MADLYLVFVAFVLASGAAHGQAVSPPVESPYEVRGQEASDYELATAIARLLVAGDSVRLLPGDAPDFLQDLLVLPPGARLLGSLQDPVSVPSAWVLASAPLPTDSAVRRFYERELPSRGWRLAETVSGLSGIDVTDRHYCRPDGWQLRVHVGEPRGERVEVRLHFSRPHPTSCPARPIGPPRVGDLLPPLYPPSGAELGTFECKDIGWSTGTLTVSSAPPGEQLLDHYGALMEEAGWRAAGPAPVVAQSWRLEKDSALPLIATVVVMEQPGSPGCADVTLVTRGVPTSP